MNSRNLRRDEYLQMTTSLERLVCTVGVWCLVVLPVSVDAKLIGQVTRDVIDYGEYIELTIESDSQTSDEPDFSPLELDFGLSNLATSSNITIRNGRQTSSRTWRVRLTPKSPGEFWIPPIPLGNESTDRMVVLVRELSRDVSEAIQTAAFYEMVVEPREQYVQGAIYITRRLHLSNRIQRISDSSVGFKVDDAVFIPIKDEYSRREYRKGQAYDVHHIEVVMFPQKSGTIVLPPIHTRASMINPHSGRRMGISVSTEQTSLNILPIPSEYPSDTPWLPATNIRLDDHLSPDSWRDIQLGSPLIRTITVHADDTHTIAIPDIELDVPNQLKAYPDSPEIQFEFKNGRIFSNKINVFNVIPTKSGEGEVGKVSLTWWDTINREVRVEELDPIVYRIASDSSTVTADDDSELVAENQTDSGAEQVQTASSSPSGALESIAGSWWWLAIGSLGWVVAALLLIFMVYARRGPQVTKQQVSMSGVRRAYRADDLPLLKRRIVEWVAQQCSTSEVEAVKLIEADEDGKRLIRDLNDAIYALTPAERTIALDELVRILSSLWQRYEHDNDSDMDADMQIAGINPVFN